ncbi:hypothetical protein ACA910_006691 [Epithemia clementina (nom. ined.)]
MNGKKHHHIRNDPDDAPWTLQTTRRAMNLLGWPTDTFAIDWVVVAPSSSLSFSATTRTSSTSSTLLTSKPRIHTVLVFVPGNPGLIEWYIPLFGQIMQALGPGYACRGVANAGHSVDSHMVDVAAAAAAAATAASPPNAAAIPWTMDGQSFHKGAFVDAVLQEFQNDIDDDDSDSNNHDNHTVQLIFVSHSIGCHFTQRLCLLRPDLWNRTSLLIHLMPFVRIQAPTLWETLLLDTIGAHPETVIALTQPILYAFSSWRQQHRRDDPEKDPQQEPTTTTPATRTSNQDDDNTGSVSSTGTGRSSSTTTNSWWRDALLQRLFPNEAGRAVLARLLSLPEFARNFFTLGCEEIRDIPEVFDVCALRSIAQHGQCFMALLFARNDVWAPEGHVRDLQQLQAQHRIPPHSNISITYRPELQHDFVSAAGSAQTSLVVQFCVDGILRRQEQLQQRQRKEQEQCSEPKHSQAWQQPPEPPMQHANQQSSSSSSQPWPPLARSKL